MTAIFNRYSQVLLSLLAACLLVLPACEKTPTEGEGSVSPPARHPDEVKKEKAAGDEAKRKAEQTQNKVTKTAGGTGSLPATKRPPGFEPATKRQAELLQGAMDKVQQNELDTAAMHLLTLIDEGPQSMEKMVGYLMLAEIYKVEGKPEKAIERLEKAEGDFPPTVELPMTVAELQQAAGNTEKAVAAMERAVKAEPNRLDVRARQVVLYAELGNSQKFIEANDAYESALQTTLNALQSETTSDEQLVAVLGSLLEHRDDRLTPVLVDLVGHENPKVIGASLEVLVNTGNKNAIDALESAALTEEREEIAAGIQSAIDYLKGMEEPPPIPEMPVDSP